MAVSLALTPDVSILAFQTPGGVYFDDVGSGATTGAPTLVTTATSDWVGVQALAGGGFSVQWGAGGGLMAQDYQADGAATGSAPHALTAAPMPAGLAFTSDAAQGAAVLGDGGQVTAILAPVSSQASQTLHIQEHDSAGLTVGADFAAAAGAVAYFTSPQVAPLAGGGYAVSVSLDSNYAAQLEVFIFAPDTSLASIATPWITGGQFPDRIAGRSIAGLPDGGFVVAFSPAAMSGQPTAPLYVAEYAADGSVAVAAHAIGALSATGAAPRIDATADGRYVVSWTSASGVESQGFTEAAPSLGLTNDSVRTADPPYGLTAGAHSLTLVGAAPQTVTANSLGNVIISNDHGSRIIGGAGADTLVSGHGADVLTGGGGADVFVFAFAPWNPSTVTDFSLGTDRADFTRLLAAEHYAGTDPVADGYLSFLDDGAGGTRVQLDKDASGAILAIPITITDLQGVSPAGLTYAALTSPSAAVSGVVIVGADSRQTLTGAAGDDTITPGHDADTLITGAGHDTIIVKDLPWNASTVVDFTLGLDRLDVTALLASIHYAGADPVADGYLSFASDGAGGARVMFDKDGSGASLQIPITVIDLMGVNPTDLSYGLLNSPAGLAASAPGETLSAQTYGAAMVGGAGADTLIADQGPDTLTGGAGADRFVFAKLPWNAGHITDFAPGSDHVDLSALVGASGYAGTEPQADGYLRLQSDGQGDTQVFWDSDGPSGDQYPTLITTLDHVAPSSLSLHDFLLH